MRLCARLACLLGLLAVGVCYADSHPPIDESAKCADCHADQASAAHLHPAIKGGCLTCHRVTTHENDTYVVLKPAKTIICAECHQPEDLLHPHFPYASAMCLRCHDPHGSANPKLLRAKVNELCLECHLRTSKNSLSRYMPTLDLTLNNTMGHPYERHPVSGVADPLNGGEMSCISCHLAHGGTMLHYLKMGSEIPADALNQNTETIDMCHKCHMRMWGLDHLGKKVKKKR